VNPLNVAGTVFIADRLSACEFAAREHLSAQKKQTFPDSELVVIGISGIEARRVLDAES
jgi:hypothetical protein